MTENATARNRLDISKSSKFKQTPSPSPVKSPGHLRKTSRMLSCMLLAWTLSHSLLHGKTEPCWAKTMRSLPLVSDFLPHSGRIAVLTLRDQPHPAHLISLYAPSQLWEVAAEARKDKFWDELQELRNNLSRAAPLLQENLGDLNARITWRIWRNSSLM